MNSDVSYDSSGIAEYPSYLRTAEMNGSENSMFFPNPGESMPSLPPEQNNMTPSEPSGGQTSPSRPSMPSVPTTPSRPSTPSTPTTPSRPSMPSTPSVPSRPTRPTPSVPSTPTQPTPSVPSRPVPPVFRPVFPGVGSSVTIIPGISFPCFQCNASTVLGRIRVLNASTGYQPFYVYLGNWLIATQLGNGNLTSYVQAAAGTQTITVAGANGYIYLQKSIMVRSGVPMTVAIINTASGLDLMEISDLSCNAPVGFSCLRTCNLSPNMGAFDVTLENRMTSMTPFTNVRFREVTPYTSVTPGQYQIFISRTGSFPGNAIASASARLNSNVSYTLYIFNAPTEAEGLRSLIVSN